MFNEGNEISAMSFPSKTMAKSGPEPVKTEPESVTPFACVSLPESIRLVILVVMFVSPLSKVDRQITPSNFSFAVVRMDIFKPLRYVSAFASDDIMVNKQWQRQE